jgi:hypothetical protein
MAGMGHEDPFPHSKPNDRYRIRKRSVAAERRLLRQALTLTMPCCHRARPADVGDWPALSLGRPFPKRCPWPNVVLEFDPVGDGKRPAVHAQIEPFHLVERERARADAVENRDLVPGLVAGGERPLWVRSRDIRRPLPERARCARSRRRDGTACLQSHRGILSRPMWMVRGIPSLLFPPGEHAISQRARNCSEYAC